jgi:hypothetical protein
MTLPKKPDVIPLALCLVLIVVMYGPFMLGGGFIYDDWSVWDLGKKSHGFVDAYRNYFGAFSDRPAAPVYYALISKFVGHFFAYSLLDTVLWVAAVLIVARVLGKQFGHRAAVLFAPFALLPTLSSTIVFSPAMQSIGALSILLWAISFLILDDAIDKKSVWLVFAAALPTLLMLATYEAALPLLVLSVAWPLVRAARRLFWLNLALVALALVAMVVYQKIIAPPLFGDISRLRATDPSQFLSLVAANTYSLAYMMCFRIPRFFLQGALELIHHGSPAAQIEWSIATTLYVALLAIPTKDAKHSPLLSLVLWMGAIIVAIFAVGVMHAGSLMGPTYIGYTNRGAAAMSILVPLLVALFADFAGTISPSARRLILGLSVLLFAGYAVSFIAQSENYIAAEQVRNRIYAEIVAETAPNQQNAVIADVPQFLPYNYNDETIFYRDLGEFGAFLSFRSQGTLRGEIITREKMCESATHIDITDSTVTVNGADPLPLGHAVFYSYGGDKDSSFQTLHNGDDLKRILGSWKGCS